MYDEVLQSEARTDRRRAPFYCVRCVLADPTDELRARAPWARHTAEALPHTHLSRHVEEAVAEELEKAGITHEPVRRAAARAGRAATA